MKTIEEILARLVRTPSRYLGVILGVLRIFSKPQLSEKEETQKEFLESIFQDAPSDTKEGALEKILVLLTKCSSEKLRRIAELLERTFESPSILEEISRALGQPKNTRKIEFEMEISFAAPEKPFEMDMFWKNGHFVSNDLLETFSRVEEVRSDRKIRYTDLMSDESSLIPQLSSLEMTRRGIDGCQLADIFYLIQEKALSPDGLNLFFCPDHGGKYTMVIVKADKETENRWLLGRPHFCLDPSERSVRIFST